MGKKLTAIILMETKPDVVIGAVKWGLIKKRQRIFPCLFSFFFFLSQKNPFIKKYFCNFALRSPPLGGRKYVYKLRRLFTLCYWPIGTSNTSITFCQKLSSDRCPLGYVYYYGIPKVCPYVFAYAWVFVARFDRKGKFEGLNWWNGHNKVPRLFCITVNRLPEPRTA